LNNYIFTQSQKKAGGHLVYAHAPRGRKAWKIGQKIPLNKLLCLHVVYSRRKNKSEAVREQAGEMK
jgi:hypothetical protein